MVLSPARFSRTSLTLGSRGRADWGLPELPGVPIWTRGGGSALSTLPRDPQHQPQLGEPLPALQPCWKPRGGWAERPGFPRLSLGLGAAICDRVMPSPGSHGAGERRAGRSPGPGCSPLAQTEQLCRGGHGLTASSVPMGEALRTRTQALHVPGLLRAPWFFQRDGEMPAELPFPPGPPAPPWASNLPAAPQNNPRCPIPASCAPPAPPAPPAAPLQAEESRGQSVAAAHRSCHPPPEQHPGERGESTATLGPAECPESILPSLSAHVQPLPSCRVLPQTPASPPGLVQEAGAGEPRSLLASCRRGARRGLTIPTLSGCRCVGKSGATGRHRY